MPGTAANFASIAAGRTPGGVSYRGTRVLRVVEGASVQVRRRRRCRRQSACRALGSPARLAVGSPTARAPRAPAAHAPCAPPHARARARRAATSPTTTAAARSRAGAAAGGASATKICRRCATRAAPSAWPTWGPTPTVRLGAAGRARRRGRGLGMRAAGGGGCNALRAARPGQGSDRTHAPRKHARRLPVHHRAEGPARAGRPQPGVWHRAGGAGAGRRAQRPARRRGRRAARGGDGPGQRRDGAAARRGRGVSARARPPAAAAL